MVWLIVIGVVVLVGLVALGFGVRNSRRRQEDPWTNEDLFLPYDPPFEPGVPFTARYRRRPKKPGSAKGVTLEANLQLQDTAGQPGGSWPVEVIDYSTDDLIEVDLMIEVPADAADQRCDLHLLVMADGEQLAHLVRPIESGQKA